MVDNGSLSFTSNRGPSSASKPSPTRTTMSSPTHASGMGLSAARVLPKLLSPRIPTPLAASLLPVREALSAASSRSYAGVADRGYGLLAAHETGLFGRCIGPGLSGFRELLMPEARFPGTPSFSASR